MSNVSGIIKSIQDIMRKDVGVDGDAQRISQLVWMFFLKIYDDREAEIELLEDAYKSPLPEHLRSIDAFRTALRPISPNRRSTCTLGPLRRAQAKCTRPTGLVSVPPPGPATPVIETPNEPLPLITFEAPAAVPPIVLPVPVLTPTTVTLHGKGLAPTLAVDAPDVEFGQAEPTSDVILEKALERVAEKKAA